VDVNGWVNADAGRVAGYDFATRIIQQRAALAGLLTGRYCAPDPVRVEMASAPRSPLRLRPYAAWWRNDMPPIVRASWLRGVSALTKTHAHESYIDDTRAAEAAGVDPIADRLVPEG